MKRRVAITGTGCISPLGIGVRIFWDRISRAESGIARITRFDCTGFDVKLAAEVKQQVEVPSEFSLYVREDHKIAFALAAAELAMAEAGLERIEGPSLIHLGTSLETFDLAKIVHRGRIDLAETVERHLREGARFLQMPLDTAGRLIESVFGRASLNLTNVSACAASTQAIGHAFRRIRDGSFDMALCGGFDSLINPLGTGGFQLLGALATGDGQGGRACRPFDSARVGTVLGEGACFFVLEPLDRAVKAGRHIYGEVLGYGSSLDACKPSAPDPEGAGAFTAMKKAVEDASLTPDGIDAVSTHGTGTFLNDEVEAAAIRALLGERWRDVPVTATKSLAGHLVGAAGAIEVAAALQGFAENRLHPNGSLSRVAPGCELDHIIGGPRPFKGKHILKNSFGFGGQNACLIIGRASDGRE